MGYTTEFEGVFKLDKPLTLAHFKYLQAFADTRRMERDPVRANRLSDPVREVTGLPVGVDGEYFVAGSGFKGQGRDDSVTDGNCPPRTQPGLWCQWVPTEDGTGITWDGGEKFYSYVEWLQYIITNFLVPWGYTLNGEVTWSGEERGDIGKIQVTNNKVKKLAGTVTYS